MATAAKAEHKGSGAKIELPAAGYPVSEEAVEYWFRTRYGRAPSEPELGAIMGEMAQRESTPPVAGPLASPRGWVTGPSAAPATRR